MRLSRRRKKLNRDIGCEADSNWRVGISKLDCVGDIWDGTRAGWEETFLWKRGGTAWEEISKSLVWERDEWKSPQLIRNGTCNNRTKEN